MEVPFHINRNIRRGLVTVASVLLMLAMAQPVGEGDSSKIKKITDTLTPTPPIPYIEPTATLTPTPTLTVPATATITNIPLPTRTLEATLTPEPTSTIEPTLTPEPTFTIVPTSTPEQTITAMPTAIENHIECELNIIYPEGNERASSTSIMGYFETDRTVIDQAIAALELIDPDGIHAQQMGYSSVNDYVESIQVVRNGRINRNGSTATTPIRECNGRHSTGVIMFSANANLYPMLWIEEIVQSYRLQFMLDMHMANNGNINDFLQDWQNGRTRLLGELIDATLIYTVTKSNSLALSNYQVNLAHLSSGRGRNNTPVQLIDHLSRELDYNLSPEEFIRLLLTNEGMAQINPRVLDTFGVPDIYHLLYGGRPNTGFSIPRYDPNNRN